MKATKGMTVEVEYEGRLEDGTLFDTNVEKAAKEAKIHQEGRPYKPLKIKLGEGMVIPGFEKAIEGMEEGQEKEVDIPVKEAYGEPKKELIKKVGKDFFQGNPAKRGDVIFVNIQGHQVPAVVAEAGEHPKIDLNHPLAGKALKFKLKLLKITK